MARVGKCFHLLYTLRHRQVDGNISLLGEIKKASKDLIVFCHLLLYENGSLSFDFQSVITTIRLFRTGLKTADTTHNGTMTAVRQTPDLAT